MKNEIKESLKASIIDGVIPFDVKQNEPNNETIKAMQESRMIASDEFVKYYDSIEELRADLEI